MIYKFDDFMNEEFKKPWFDRNKEKMRIFFKKLKIEIDQTKEAKNALMKYVRGEEISEEEILLIRQQSMDVLKGLGMGTIFMLPGGGLLLPFLLKKGQKLGIDLVPSAFKEPLNENFKIIDDKTDEAFKLMGELFGTKDDPLQQFVPPTKVPDHIKLTGIVGDMREDGFREGSIYYGKEAVPFKNVFGEQTGKREIKFEVSIGRRVVINILREDMEKIENIFPDLDYHTRDLNMVEELIRDYISHTYNIEGDIVLSGDFKIKRDNIKKLINKV